MVVLLATDSFLACSEISLWSQPGWGRSSGFWQRNKIIIITTWQTIEFDSFQTRFPFTEIAFALFPPEWLIENGKLYLVSQICQRRVKYCELVQATIMKLCIKWQRRWNEGPNIYFEELDTKHHWQVQGKELDGRDCSFIVKFGMWYFLFPWIGFRSRQPRSR